MDRTDEDNRVPLDIDEARVEQMLAGRLRNAERASALEQARHWDDIAKDAIAKRDRFLADADALAEFA